MRINQNIPDRAALEGSQSPNSAARVTSVGQPKGDPEGSAGSVDKVDVSSTAEVLHSLLNLDQAQRSEKVSELAALYRSGQFVVDVDALSDAILRHEEKTSPTVSQTGDE
jgi:anti-sigma28 factor (negative regulator of flagellin synthesis)